MKRCFFCMKQIIVEMVRPPCCDHKLNRKRGLWTPQEDAKILAYVAKHGIGNWTALPKKAGLQRCGKSCRLRWTNYLRPDLKHDSFTPQEEEMIVRLHSAIGSRWSIIAQQLPGRTDNDVKNYWNTRLRKKLSEMGIDPVTHKPFSQILADYGNIGGLLKSRSRIGSLSKDLKNASTSKPEFCPSRPEGISNINNSQNLMETTALTPSKMEPIQECFLHNSILNSDTNDSNHYSLDLLDQLKAIKLVTEASNCIEVQAHMSPYNFLNEEASLPISASSSPASSTCSTAAEENLQASFSWTDFLLEDAFHIPTDDHPQEDQTMVEFSSKDLIMSQQQNIVVTSQGQNETNYCHQVNNVRVEGMDLEVLSNNGFDDHNQAVSSSANSSFVETILDLESKMLLDFPHLVDEPFYY